jgi:hypothetical protein
LCPNDVEPFTPRSRVLSRRPLRGTAVVFSRLRRARVQRGPFRLYLHRISATVILRAQY